MDRRADVFRLRVVAFFLLCVSVLCILAPQPAQAQQAEQKIDLYDSPKPGDPLTLEKCVHVKKLVPSSPSGGSVTLPTPEECKIALRPGFYFAGWVAWNDVERAQGNLGEEIAAYPPGHIFNFRNLPGDVLQKNALYALWRPVSQRTFYYNLHHEQIHSDLHDRSRVPYHHQRPKFKFRRTSRLDETHELDTSDQLLGSLEGLYVNTIPEQLLDASINKTSDGLKIGEALCEEYPNPKSHRFVKWTCKEVPGWSHKEKKLTGDSIVRLFMEYRKLCEQDSTKKFDLTDKKLPPGGSDAYRVGKRIFTCKPTGFTLTANFDFAYYKLIFDLNDGSSLRDRVLTTREEVYGYTSFFYERPMKSRSGLRFVGWCGVPSPPPDRLKDRALIHRALPPPGYFGGKERGWFVYTAGEEAEIVAMKNSFMWNKYREDCDSFSPAKYDPRRTSNPNPEVYPYTKVDFSQYVDEKGEAKLYAIWAPKSPTAKFRYVVNDKAGGYVTNKEEEVPTEGDQEPKGSTAVANPGWVFDGWYDLRISGNVGLFPICESETLSPAAIKRAARHGYPSGTRDYSIKSYTSRYFQARFVKLERYKVAFSANVPADEGASITVPEEAKVAARHSFLIPLSIPKRSGYQFTDWDTDPEGKGASYRPGDVIDNVMGNITLYAQWIKDTEAKLSYSVNNSERGKVSLAKEIFFASTGTPSGATASALENSNFKRWTCNLDPDWELKSPTLTKEEIDKVAKNDAGLYVTAFFTAHFEPTFYKLSFDKGGVVPEEALKTRLVTPGATVDLPEEIPSDPDRTFVNWNDRIDGKGASYRPGDKITVKEDTKLYARWVKAGEAKFTYSVDANDNTKGSVTRSEEVISVSGGFPLGSSAVPKEGHDFKWWKCNLKPDWKSTEPLLEEKHISAVAKDETGAYKTAFFTAHFEAKDCKITFKGGGTGETGLVRDVPEAGSVKYGQDFTIPTQIPQRTGYKFMFWCTARDGKTGALYKPGAVIKGVRGDMTLYALWERATYEVVVNYGDGKSETHQVTYGEDFELPKPGKIPAGKMLKGVKIDDKGDDLKQPGIKILITKDTKIEYVVEDAEKTVTLTYKVSDPKGGTLSLAQEKIAPNADKVSGTTLTLTDGWELTGWRVEGNSLSWDKSAGLTLTQAMIDSAAKKEGKYTSATFTAVVKKTPVTVTIIYPDGTSETREITPDTNFKLPKPDKIPAGKTLKGVKIDDKGDDLKQPETEILITKDTKIEYVVEDAEKTVTLTYKVSDPKGGTLSLAQEKIAPNADKVSGTTLTLTDGWELTGWSVEDNPLSWDKSAGLTLTQAMIDSAAKKEGKYTSATFTALVKKTPVTVTIIYPDGTSETKEITPNTNFKLPKPDKIPAGKTLKGVKIDDKGDDLKQPETEILITKDTKIEYVVEDAEKTVTLTYKVSDPKGGTLSLAQEKIAPNADKVSGTTLTLTDGWELTGWSVEDNPLSWDKSAGLTLTQAMIDSAAKKEGKYTSATFTALVKKTPVTVTIIYPDGTSETKEITPNTNFKLPKPDKIPAGKTLKGVKIDDKGDDLKQPETEILITKDTKIEYVVEDAEKTVTLTYKVSDPKGGTLSLAQEKIAPNADKVSGTTLTLTDGWELTGWSVEDNPLSWDKSAGLTLTQAMIDSAAKKEGKYTSATFTAVVKKTPVTVTITYPDGTSETKEITPNTNFKLPKPDKIPAGKTLKGVKIDDKGDDLKQPETEILITKDTKIEYVVEDAEKTVTLTYKVSDSKGGTLSLAQEKIAPNADKVSGTTLTLTDGWELTGWSVEDNPLSWDKSAGLTLTQAMIDSAAKKEGKYTSATFTAVVKKTPVTVTIIYPDGTSETKEITPDTNFKLPKPDKIPAGKTLKGVKIDDKGDDLKQPETEILITKDTKIEYVVEDAEKTVTLTYKVSDSKGGTLSLAQEKIAPNADKVSGTTLTLTDGWELTGWSVEDNPLSWDKSAGLTLTQAMIDSAAKKEGKYTSATFTAVVKKTPVTVTIIYPDGTSETKEITPNTNFKLPKPDKIPAGKTLKGVKIDDKGDDLKQPETEILITKDTKIEYVVEDAEKTVTLTYKVSDSKGGTLSLAQEKIAPNADKVSGTTLTLTDGWELMGWSVEDNPLSWDKSAGLTLTQAMIDSAAKKEGKYTSATFTAVVKKTPVTVTIIYPDGTSETKEITPNTNFKLPKPDKIPAGKTLKGVKIDDKGDDLKQPETEILITKDTKIEYVVEDAEKTVTLTYKVSDSKGGTLSLAQEKIAPNADKVSGTTLTLTDGWELTGWSVEDNPLSWDKSAGLTLTQAMIDSAAKKEGKYTSATFTALVKKTPVTVTIIYPDGTSETKEITPNTNFKLPKPDKIPAGKTLKGVKIDDKGDDLKQPETEILITKDTKIEYVVEDAEKTVTLTYKVSDSKGGTLSLAQEKIAPNADKVSGTTLTLTDGWELTGWSVEDNPLSWDKSAGLTLTQAMIDSAAKKEGKYTSATFTAVVKKTPVTVTIIYPDGTSETKEITPNTNFKLPKPDKIPAGKTLKGVKIDDKGDDLKQPETEILITKDTKIEYVVEDAEKTVTLTYKVSDSKGGTLSLAQEKIAPNADKVSGTTLTLTDGWELTGWSVEDNPLSWDKSAGLTLTQAMIDSAAKKEGKYTSATFTAVVKKTPVTVTIIYPDGTSETKEITPNTNFKLPKPDKIPADKTLKGVKIDDKGDDLKQPETEILITKDTKIEYVVEDAEKTVTLTYKVSDPKGGTLSLAQEKIAPNADKVSGTTLTLTDGWELTGWSVEDNPLSWDKSAGLTLTQAMIDSAAKKEGKYTSATFTAVVKKTPVTVTIIYPDGTSETKEITPNTNFKLPKPDKIPAGKTLKGVKIDDKGDDLKQPETEILITKDTKIEYVVEDAEKTVTLTYKVSDPKGGTLSLAQEKIAPNADKVSGTTLTLTDGWELTGWSVEDNPLSWDKSAGLTLTQAMIDSAAKKEGKYTSATFTALVKKTPVTVTIIYPDGTSETKEITPNTNFKLPKPDKIPAGKTLKGVKIDDKGDDLKQPETEILITKDTKIEYVVEDAEKTVTLTYKVSDPKGGTLSLAQEKIAPNADKVSGTTLTLTDGWELTGWSVEDNPLSWDKSAGLTLTQAMIDSAAKKEGKYTSATFTAVVKKTPVTVTIIYPDGTSETKEITPNTNFKLPKPDKIPAGKTLKGVKIDDKGDDLKQPETEILITKDTKIEYVVEDAEKTVTLTYKVSDSKGGTLSLAQEKIAPNADKVSGTTLTLTDGWELTGWSVEDNPLSWDKSAGLTLTQAMIDSAAKKEGKYTSATFTALVKKTPVTVTIIYPDGTSETKEITPNTNFKLPKPDKIPAGKTLKGVKIDDKGDDLKQPETEILITKDTKIEYVVEDAEKTVTLTYKVSDPKGGTLSLAQEKIAPNADKVSGTTLTLTDGWELTGWSVEDNPLSWDKSAGLTLTQAMIDSAAKKEGKYTSATFTAVVKKTPVTVTIIYPDGTSETKEITPNTNFKLPKPDKIPAGKTLKGVKIDDKGDDLKQPETEILITKDTKIEYVVEDAEKTVTLTYKVSDSKGGTLSLAQEKIAPNADKVSGTTLTLTDGWELTGWSVEDNPLSWDKSAGLTLTQAMIDSAAKKEGKYTSATFTAVVKKTPVTVTIIYPDGTSETKEITPNTNFKLPKPDKIPAGKTLKGVKIDDKGDDLKQPETEILITKDTKIEYVVEDAEKTVTLTYKVSDSKGGTLSLAQEKIAPNADKVSGTTLTLTDGWELTGWSVEDNPLSWDKSAGLTLTQAMIDSAAKKEGKYTSATFTAVVKKTPVTVTIIYPDGTSETKEITPNTNFKLPKPDKIPAGKTLKGVKIDDKGDDLKQPETEILITKDTKIEYVVEDAEKTVTLTYKVSDSKGGTLSLAQEKIAPNADKVSGTTLTLTDGWELTGWSVEDNPLSWDKSAGLTLTQAMIDSAAKKEGKYTSATFTAVVKKTPVTVTIIYPDGTSETKEITPNTNFKLPKPDKIPAGKTLKGVKIDDKGDDLKQPETEILITKDTKIEYVVEDAEKTVTLTYKVSDPKGGTLSLAQEKIAPNADKVSGTTLTLTDGWELTGWSVEDNPLSWDKSAGLTLTQAMIDSAAKKEGKYTSATFTALVKKTPVTVTIIYPDGTSETKEITPNTNFKLPKPDKIPAGKTLKGVKIDDKGDDLKQPETEILITKDTKIEYVVEDAEKTVTLTYKVSDSKGGTLSLAQEKIAPNADKVSGTTLTLTDGWELTGWSVEDNPLSWDKSAGLTLTQAMIDSAAKKEGKYTSATFTAVVKKTPVTVTIIYPDGTSETKEITPNTNFKLPKPDKIPAGKTLKGVKIDDKGDDLKQPETEILITKDTKIEYVVEDAEKTVTLTYKVSDSKGGTLSLAQEKIAPNADKVSGTTLTLTDGWELTGWSVEDNPLSWDKSAGLTLTQAMIDSAAKKEGKYTSATFTALVKKTPVTVTIIYPDGTSETKEITPNTNFKLPKPDKIPAGKTLKGVKIDDKGDDLKQPETEILITKDTKIEYVVEDAEKTVTLTYKVSDSKGGTLSLAQEKIAPNADKVSGTTLTLTDGWELTGWSVEDNPLSWDKSAGLTLTQAMIDSAAKKEGKYTSATFTAVVKKTPVTVTIIYPDGTSETKEITPNTNFKLPKPDKIPAGKTLKGVKIDDKGDDLKEPETEILITKDTKIEYVVEDAEKTVTLTYKVSDSKGGTLSLAQEKIAPNADKVSGTTLTLTDGWELTGWSVEDNPLSWDKSAGLTLTQAMIDSAAKKEGKYTSATFTAVVKKTPVTVTIIYPDGTSETKEITPNTNFKLPKPDKIPAGKTLKGVKIDDKGDDLKQPETEILITKDTKIEYVVEDAEKTVTLTYKVSDPKGGTLSLAQEKIAPNADKVSGTTLTLTDGWELMGWSVEDNPLSWDKSAGLTLTQAMIDSAAKKEGKYTSATFTAVVKKTPVTVTIIYPDGTSETKEITPNTNFKLPKPDKIPAGKTLKGVKIDDKGDDLKQPETEILITKDTKIEYVVEDAEKTVTLTYKVSDSKGGTLSLAQEKIAPNADKVSGTTLTLTDGWELTGWSVEDNPLSWDKSAGLTLTQAMIDSAAKKEGKYTSATFTAVVKKTPVTVTIIYPDGTSETKEITPNTNFKLPKPDKIPAGKTLKGVKIDDKGDDLKQPETEILITKDTKIEYVVEDAEKTVTLTYKVSDPKGGTLSLAQEKIAPNADKVSGTTLTLTDGWELTGWSVEDNPLSWDKSAGLTLTQAMIDSAAKKEGKYTSATFTALVKKTPVTVTIIYPDGTSETKEITPNTNFKLPKPDKIPAGKTLKGVKIDDKGDDLKQPETEILITKDTKIEYVVEDAEKTVTLTYKVSDSKGGTLSLAQEKIAPNADKVSGTTLTLTDGWELTGWSVEDNPLSWDKSAGLTLTQAMIDSAAKKEGKYTSATFTALVKKTPVTVTIIYPDGTSETKEITPNTNFKLPKPDKIPAGKTLKGVKIDDKGDDLKQPETEILITKDTKIEYVVEDAEKTVTLTYKVSDPKGGTLSLAQEKIAPNADKVSGTTLTLTDGWELTGWSVEDNPLSWDKSAGLTLTQAMIDSAAKKEGKYTSATFTALVKKTPVTVTIIYPDGTSETKEITPNTNFKLPKPDKIPAGKTLKGVKIDDKGDDLKQPETEILITKDTKIEYVVEDAEKTVTLTYKVSDSKGGTLSLAQEKIAPNADKVSGTTLTLTDGWELTGWSVEDNPLSWDKSAGLTLTQAMIDSAAKKEGKYTSATFTAVVKKTPVTVTITYPDGTSEIKEITPNTNFKLPKPDKIPAGKMLKGVKIDGKGDDLKQPGTEIPITKDTKIEYVVEDAEKTVTLTYKVSDPKGGTLSLAQEKIAPNADKVSGTTLTLTDGWELTGWSVEDNPLSWDKSAGLTLTQAMIDSAAKKEGKYTSATFTALVKKTPVTVTIIYPDGTSETKEITPNTNFKLPKPDKIPAGKTLKGVKIDDKGGDLKEPGTEILITKDTKIEYVVEDAEKTVTLTYKVSDPKGGTLSLAQEKIAPNADKVSGTTLTLTDGWELTGWSVEDNPLSWDKSAGLTLTQAMIDSAAKKEGKYTSATFTAVVKKTTFTVTITYPDGTSEIKEITPNTNFKLPKPDKIPAGKTLKGVKIDGKEGDLKEPETEILITKDTKIEYVVEDAEKTVTLTYKVSDPKGGTLSLAQEKIAPNADKVSGTTLTLTDGWELMGWSVEDNPLSWDKSAGLTLTQAMIDSAAKKEGKYTSATFTAVVKKTTFTVTITYPDGTSEIKEITPNTNFKLPKPDKIPAGKMLKGVKINGKEGDLKEPGTEIPITANTKIEYVVEDAEKTVTLTYKVSDPKGGTLSLAQEKIAPNADKVSGTTLTLTDGWELMGWSVEDNPLSWDKSAGLTLTQAMIDSAAKKEGKYTSATFTALVKKTTFTVTITYPDGTSEIKEITPNTNFKLPKPDKIPAGKMLKGVKIDGKEGDLKEPGTEIPITANTKIEYVVEDAEKTVTLTYKVSDPKGGTLSLAQEKIAPNADKVSGTTLTLTDGWELMGWSVEDNPLSWDKSAGLTLTQAMIDSAAKKEGKYTSATFTAVVKKTTFTVTIIYPDGTSEIKEITPNTNFKLPKPDKIPAGKMLKGVKIDGKEGDLKEPGTEIPITKDTKIEYVVEDAEKTVTLTYKVSDPKGGTLSLAQEKIAPNADKVSGTTLTLTDGWELMGWSVEDNPLSWDKSAGLTLTQAMIDSAAKKEGKYTSATFTAVVKKTTFTVTITYPDGTSEIKEITPNTNFKLPKPDKIPAGKMLKGVKIDGKEGDLKEPGTEIPITANTKIEYVVEDAEKTVTLTYKVSDPKGGTLSLAQEKIAPNADKVSGTTLTLTDGWELTGWSVEDNPLSWDKSAGLTLTQAMIDSAAKKEGKYTSATFTAVVKKTTFTVTITYPDGTSETKEITPNTNFKLPKPDKIPAGKMLKGVKIDGKEGDLKEPGTEIPITKDTKIEYVVEDAEKTVTLTYKVSDPKGGTLSLAQEKIAPNADKVSGTTLTLTDGWELMGWSVEDNPLSWDKSAGLTLTQAMIDSAAKKEGKYTSATFTAVVKKTTFTVTITYPDGTSEIKEITPNTNFKLPKPDKIPAGKMLKGVKIDGKEGDLKEPGTEIPITANTKIEYVVEDAEKTVTLTYKVSDPKGGTLSLAQEKIAPNADKVSGTTLTLTDGWELMGWSVEDNPLSWDKSAGLTLTQAMIDSAAKKEGKYTSATFTALVKKTVDAVRIGGIDDSAEGVGVKTGTDLVSPKSEKDGGDDHKTYGRDDSFRNDDRDTATYLAGWQRLSGKVYYYRDGKKLTGWHELNGTIQNPSSSKKNWFYFSGDGVMLTGRHRLVGGFANAQGVQGQHWFGLDEVTGAQIRYWQKVGHGSSEKWYYYRPEDGTGLVGRHHIVGGFANAQGVHEKNWFFFDINTGAEIRGWHGIVENGRENWYYYRDGDGIMLKGQHQLVGGFDQCKNWFYFDEVTGIEVRGWKEIKYQNKWCYYRDGDGIMLKGQHELVGGFDQCKNWFYFDEVTGGEIRGWKYIDYQNKWCYYRDSDGIMLKGQHRLQGGDNGGMNWFYFDEVTGAELRNCWKRIPSQNKTCYYGSDGAMYKGWRRIGGRNRYFDRITGALRR